jgi:hypothetical protein
MSDDDVVDELADRRWKRGEREREAATSPDAEVGLHRREALDWPVISSRNWRSAALVSTCPAQIESFRTASGGLTPDDLATLQHYGHTRRVQTGAHVSVR